MNVDSYEFERSGSQTIPTLGQYASRTFLWMFLGLMITFGVSMALIVSGRIYSIYSIPGIPIILLIGQLVVVIALSAGVNRMGVATARGLFLLYCVLSGVTFSTIFIYYRLGSVLLAFAAASVYFAALAAYGFLTRTNLIGLGPILMVGLLVMLVFWLIAPLLGLAGLERILCLVGIALFLALTAYDTQMIKNQYSYYYHSPELLEKASIFSALQLYLDFLNLFLQLLRFFSRNRN